MNICGIKTNKQAWVIHIKCHDAGGSHKCTILLITRVANVLQNLLEISISKHFKLVNLVFHF